MTREEAITRLKNMAWLYGSVEREQNIEAIDMAIKSLSADRPKGEWVRMWASEHETCPLSRCSNCNEEYPSIADNYNYCPICGADMRGEKHEFSK